MIWLNSDLKTYPIFFRQCRVQFCFKKSNGRVQGCVMSLSMHQTSPCSPMGVLQHTIRYCQVFPPVCLVVFFRVHGKLRREINNFKLRVFVYDYIGSWRSTNSLRGIWHLKLKQQKPYKLLIHSKVIIFRLEVYQLAYCLIFIHSAIKCFLAIKMKAGGKQPCNYVPVTRFITLQSFAIRENVTINVKSVNITL